MITEAIILSAGEATRLGAPLYPKCFTAVRGQTVLWRQTEHLSKHGITHIVLTQLERYKYFNEGSMHGIPITVSVDREPLGTAGSIKNALHCLKGDQFFVMYGDSFADIDFAEFGKLTPRALAWKKENYPFGVVSVNVSRRLSHFTEKPAMPTNLGFYLMDRAMAEQFPERGSFERDVLPRYIQERSIKCYEHTGIYRTVNTPGDIANWEQEVEK